MEPAFSSGSLMWIFSDEKYPDYDGYTMYDTLSAAVRPRPSLTLVSEEEPVSVASEICRLYKMFFVSDRCSDVES